jgi:hypothetical protein
MVYLNPCLFVRISACPAIPIAKPRNSVCKSFVHYGRFRLSSSIPDSLSLSTGVRAEFCVFALSIERCTAALANANLQINTISTNFRAPLAWLISSRVTNMAEDLSASVASLCNKYAKPFQELAALRFSEFHGKPPRELLRGSVYRPCISLWRFYRFCRICRNVE